MTLEPASAGQVERLTEEFVALRDQIAPDASLAELTVFAKVSTSLGLDPFAGQICLVPRWNKAAGRMVYRHTITVAGRRALADRTGRLEGIDGPEWTGPRDDAGALNWLELWDDDGTPPYAARCLVHVAGWKVPANGTAKWSEFAQTDNRGAVLATWQQMPSHMLGKVAEAMALRRGFPEVAAAVTLGPALELDGDDVATIAEATASPPRAALEPDDAPTEGQLRLLASLAEALGVDLELIGGRPIEELSGTEARQVIDELKAEARRRATSE